MWKNKTRQRYNDSLRRFYKRFGTDVMYYDCIQFRQQDEFVTHNKIISTAASWKPDKPQSDLFLAKIGFLSRMMRVNS